MFISMLLAALSVSPQAACRLAGGKEAGMQLTSPDLVPGAAIPKAEALSRASSPKQAPGKGRERRVAGARCVDRLKPGRRAVWEADYPSLTAVLGPEPLPAEGHEGLA